MKYIIPILLVVLSVLLSANEDHLVMVPTPIQDEEDDRRIYIVNVPIISGYGANFEGYINRITEPYSALHHSPSTKMDKINLNPASLAGVSLRAVLAKDNIYDVTIDYTKVTGHWLKDRRLLRNIIKCVYLYGDSLHGSHHVVRFKLVGISSESDLHTELFKCSDLRNESTK